MTRGQPAVGCRQASTQRKPFPGRKIASTARGACRAEMLSSFIDFRFRGREQMRCCGCVRPLPARRDGCPTLSHAALCGRSAEAVQLPAAFPKPDTQTFHGKNRYASSATNERNWFRACRRGP